jgi:dimethylhistidine N-methyltransferase
MPCKFFYDAAGSALFEAICELPEYYLTRTETAILTQHAEAIAAQLGPRVRVVEFGSGSSAKTTLLLDRLVQPAAYVPVDIAREQLDASVRRLRARYPRLLVEPVCADYTAAFALPPAPAAAARTIVFFPGSTIGNFTAAEMARFLGRMIAVCGRSGGLLVGVDLQKDLDVLLPAYNDAAGVTAAFNRNLLVRCNHELGADFDLDAFDHRAVWNAALGRIEMQLVSGREQAVRVAGSTLHFAKGEVITTEYSHKFTLGGFAAAARASGLQVEHVWTDPRAWFSVQFLRAV